MEDHSKDELLGVCVFNRLYCNHPAHFNKATNTPRDPSRVVTAQGGTPVCVWERETPTLNQLQTRPVYTSNSVKRRDSNKSTIVEERRWYIYLTQIGTVGLVGLAAADVA